MESPSPPSPAERFEVRSRNRQLSSSSSSASPSSRVIYSDRFIPSRLGSNFSLFNVDSPPRTGGKEGGSGAYAAILRTVIFGPDHGVVPPETPERSWPGRAGSSSSSPSSAPSSSFSSPSKNIFRFKAEVPKYSLASVGFDDPLPGISPRQPKVPRKVLRSPYKVLDAPALQDDFYLNLVDWSQNNVLAVGLGNCVYLWNACSGKVTKLCDLGGDDGVCSVGWARRGTHLAVGTSLGKVQICGLKWSYDNRQLASGGNDNRLFVWNQNSTNPVHKYLEHTAAIKAIAWSPHVYGLLASGGGTTDRCIRFWNTTTNSHLSCMDSGSQVCNIVWSKNVNELVSTHGYSQNQIIVWQYPEMSKVATLTGHTFRVLYLAISPDGQTIVTGAGDETLRFWNVFPSAKYKSIESKIGAFSLGRTEIR